MRHRTEDQNRRLSALPLLAALAGWWLAACDPPAPISPQLPDAAQSATDAAADGHTDAAVADRSLVDRATRPDASAGRDGALPADAAVPDAAVTDTTGSADRAIRDRDPLKDLGLTGDSAGARDSASEDRAAEDGGGRRRLFSFAIITDLHIGRDFSDYGTAGYDDTGGGDDQLTARLATAVARINANVDRYDIALVMALGDSSDSGERSELARSKQLLDQLAVPYFPLIGNHDIWPYTDSEEAPSPLGDRYFETVFEPQFQALTSAFASFERAPTPVPNPDTGLVSSFINFGFDHGGYHFVALDLATRKHKPLGGRGTMTDADLHDFAGGTWPWFTDYLARLPDLRDRNVLVFCHHPLLVDSLGIDGLSISERDQIDDFIRSHGYGDNIYGFFSGHHHLNYELVRFQGQHVVATADCADNSTVRVVQVYSDGAIDLDSFL